MARKGQTGNAARVARFRARQRERRDFVRDMVEKDVQVIVEQTVWGTLRITWEMSPETDAALKAWCQERGYSLDDMLQDLNKEALAKASRDAKEGRMIPLEEERRLRLDLGLFEDLMHEHLLDIGCPEATAVFLVDRWIEQPDWIEELRRAPGDALRRGFRRFHQVRDMMGCKQLAEELDPDLLYR